MSKEKFRKRIPKLAGFPRRKDFPEGDEDLAGQIAEAMTRSKAGKGTARDAELLAMFLGEMMAYAEKTEEEEEDEPDPRELRVTINRLLRFFGSRTEHSATLLGDQLPRKRERARRGIPDDKPRRKRTRAAGSTTSAEEIHYPHPELKIGDRCPECDRGNLYGLEAGNIPQIIGSLLFHALVHRPERLRCSGCQKVYTAAVPETANAYSDPTANAMAAMMRYGLGAPLYRLSQLQEFCGVRIAPSTFWDMTERAADAAWPIFEELKFLAAQCALIHADDTDMTILAHAKERDDGERKATRTTGILARDLIDHSSAAETAAIHLFLTGSRHAGENIADLLALRDHNLPPPLYMADALSRNFPDPDLLNYVSAQCNIHARRNFVDCLKAFPEECGHVLRQYRTVYRHEGRCRKARMTPLQRLAYHQKRSGPIMENLRKYAERKLERREVEPNSSLGQAFRYLLKHWEGLTRFLHVAGCPLDNNADERLIKKAILHRKNSLFYKTANGAAVGDILMSVIHTAIASGISPFDYLTTLQRHRAEVLRNPGAWLPWNYAQDYPNFYETSAAA